MLWRRGGNIGTRMLIFPIIALTAGLAVQAQSGEVIRGRFFYAEGNRIEGHRSKATINLSNFLEIGPHTMVEYPGNLRGDMKKAEFKAKPIPKVPMVKFAKGLMAIVKTDGRENTGMLMEDVTAPPAGSHNELIITMVRIPGVEDWDLAMRVAVVKD